MNFEWDQDMANEIENLIRLRRRRFTHCYVCCVQRAYLCGEYYTTGKKFLY